ncbi:MAG: T9SS type A sorting domain-containing protein [Flammeovirgaceae bacterium]
MKKKLLLLICSFLLAPGLVAQTGPGGVGNSTGASGQPQTFFWYKLSDLGLADNASITSLTDYSGNGVNLGNTALSGTNTPTFQSDAGNTLNGLAIGTFSNSRLVSTVSSFPTSEITTFVVYNTSANGDGLLSYDANDGVANDNDYLLFINSDNTLRVYVNETSGDFWGTGQNVSGLGWTILGHTWSNTAGSSLYLNGNNVANDATHMTVGSPTIDFNASAVFALAGEQDGPDGDNNSRGQEYAGDIAEVVVFGSNLNAVRRSIVENYLSAKHGLALTAGNLYAGDDAGNGDFDFGVIGIGQESTGDHTSASADGLAFTENGTTLDDGDYLLMGYNATTNVALTSDIAGVAGLEARWNRVWYADLTDADDGLRIDLTFDADDAGIGTLDMSVANTSDYVLLYRAGTSGSWTSVSTASSIDNASNSVTFTNLDITGNGDGYYTLGTLDNTASPIGSTAQTWYTFSTGNWSDAANWTLDPSATPQYDNPGSEIPDANDDVVINTGRTITLDINNIEVQSIEINGVINLSSSTGNDFNVIKGSGVIQMEGLAGVDNFPDGAVTGSGNFSNAVDGGTLRLVGSGVTLNQSREFNNVQVEMDNATAIVTLSADYVLNGNLIVNNGIWQFDGTASRNLTVNEDVVINYTSASEFGTINVASGNVRHQLNMYGDFTNAGIARFTNRDETVADYADPDGNSNESDSYYTNEATDGIIDANFLSATDNQTVTCSNTTVFYRIEVNKGSDATYQLDLTATNANFFYLLGYADETHGSGATDNQLTDNANALGLIYGTVRLESNITIAELSVGNNYNISEGAAIWVDGGTLNKDEEFGAIVVYGLLRVTDGTVNSYVRYGITMRNDGLLQVEGGTVNTWYVRCSNLGAGNVGGYVQSGGTVNIDPSSSDESNTASFDLPYTSNTFAMTGGTLHIQNPNTDGEGLLINSDPGNQNVTGGTVIMEISAGTTNNFDFTSRAPFYNLIIRDNSNLTSTTHRVTQLTSDPGPVTLAAQDVVVLNDLTIETADTRSQTINGRSNVWGSYLDLCPSNSCINLEVAGDFTIEDSGVLDVWAWDGTDNDGSATVTMNGTTDATLYVGDIATYTNDLVEYRNPDNGPWPSGFDGQDETYGIYTLPFYNWYIDKSGATLSLAAKLPSKGNGTPGGTRNNYKTSNGGKNLSRYAVRLIQVVNDFQLLNGTLSQIDPLSTLQLTEGDGTDFGTVGDQVVYGMYLQGTITINGNCFVYTPGSTRKDGTVNIRTENDVTINSVDGATIGNLEVNNEGYVVTLTSDLDLGRLQYAAGIIDIGTYNLKIDEFEFLELSSSNFIPNVSGQGIYSLTDYIRMAGNASDGGLSIKMPRSLTSYGNSPPSFPDASYTAEYNIVDRSEYYLDGLAYNRTDRMWFPIGTNANSNERYTPAVMHIVDESGVTYSGDEYVTVRVVDAELQTTNLSGGDILQYYWRVSTEGFDGGSPTISWIFQYDDSDVSGTEADYVPGKVLDGGTYQRSYDGTDQAVKEGGSTGNNGNLLGTNPQNVILFNGDNLDTADPITITDIAGDEIDTGTGDALYTYQDITVDGNWSAVWPGTGFSLEDANYTAGAPNRFLGSPQIFYTVKTDNSSTTANAWSDPDSWSFTETDGPQNTGSATPGAGDVVIFGAHDSDVHGFASEPIRLSVDVDTEVAVALFEEPETGESRARVFPQPGTNHTWDFLGGSDGELQLFFTSDSDIPTFDTSSDLSEFLRNTSSTWNLANYSTDVGASNIITLPTFPAEFPILRVTGNNANNGGNGTADNSWSLRQIVNFPMDIKVNAELQVANVSGLYVTHDIEIAENFDVGVGFGHGHVRIENGTNPIDITVGGDLVINGNTGSRSGDSYFEVETGGGNGIEHTLTIGGNIQLLEDNTGDGNDAYFDLYTTSADNNMILELNTANTSTFTRAGNNVPDLYKLVMNKGTDTTSSFTIANEVTFPLPSDISAQPIEIRNGLLVLNNASIDVTLTDAARGDFKLPNTDNLDASSGSGGLEVAAGTVRVEGDDTGVILDGLLRVSGGTFTMEDATNNGNNFIEYSASGNALLEVSGGSLIVGSQVRRSAFSQAGVLKYRQTGGTVSIGRNDFTPEADRGVFEILNTGSEFTHTGGTFTIERSNGSATVASLLLEPETFDFGTTTTITLGSANTPASTTFGIQTSEYINTLETSNAGGNNPTIAQYNTSLNVDGELIIGNGTTFDTRGRALNIRGNNIANGNSVFQNNGTFTANSNTTTFEVSDTKTISGSASTAFYDFTNTGSGTLQLTTSGSATNDVTLSAGTFNTLTNTFTVLGDVFNDATHASTGGEGIKMEGTTIQTIQRTSPGSSDFGVLTINNGNGVRIPDNDYEFTINNKLVLESGIFDIGGNLLIFSATATDIENGSGGTAVTDFSISNMIQTNSSIRDFGVKKFVNSGADTYVFPVGQLVYTPVQINVTSLTSASGHFLVRPVNDQTLGILEDSEQNPSSGGPCPGDTEIVDADNVLNYYWIVKSDGLSNFSTANASGNGMLFYYDASDLPTPTSPYTTANYGPARLLTSSSNWDKVPLFADDFNQATQEIVFHFSNADSDGITGIYTGGITLESDGTTQLCGGGAIPTTVPEYVTINSGEDEFDETTYEVTWTDNGGSAVPSGGPFGADIVVKSGFTLVLNNDAVRLRKTTVESGATLKISNTDNHNLGFVEGGGTIEIVSTGSDAKLPTGDYEEFFPTSSDCSNQGSLIYSGSGDYFVMSELSAVYNLSLTESGNRTMPNKDILVCNNLTFDEDGGSLAIDNSFYNRDMEVRGNIIRNDGSFNAGSGTATITLGGTALQTIDGDFTSPNDFNRLTFNNSAGFTVVNSGNNDVEVSNAITLTNGIVETDANNSLTLLVGGTITGGSYTTHINGPFIRELAAFNQSYRLPLGDEGYYGLMEIVNPDNYGGTKRWEAQYYFDTPNTPYTVAPTSGFQRTSLQEYWRVNDGNTSGSDGAQAQIKLVWHQGSDVQSTANLFMAYYDDNNSRWDRLDYDSGPSGNGVDGEATSVYLAFSENFVTFATTDSNTTVLPVELLSFKAFLNNEAVELQWATAAESNSSHFLIEKRNAAGDFVSIGRVEAQGNSTTLMNYRFYDLEPQVGGNYYRLKQVDLDGSFTNSRVVEVIIDSEGESVALERSILLYPNPTYGAALNVELNGFVSTDQVLLEIHDLMGKRVFAQTIRTDKLAFVNSVFDLTRSLVTGVYIVSVFDGNERISERVVIK